MTDIRNYEPADLPACRSLWLEMVQRHREIYDDPSIGGGDPGMEFDTHLARVGVQNIWLSTDGKEITGLVSLIHNGEQAEVEPIVVSSRHRGRGIGRALLEHAVEKATSIGVLCLSVKPVARNEGAISFFREAGFKTVGHIELFMWLGPSSQGQWKPGLELFGKTFDY